MEVETILGGAALLIIVLGLCNPRLRRYLKNRRSSMDDVLDQGREDLKVALRSKKGRKP